MNRSATRRSHHSVLSSLSAVLATRLRWPVALLMAMGLSRGVGVARADQILDVYNSSLTTYLPTGTTPVHGLRPTAFYRGVNVDGSLRAALVLGWGLAGNPFGESWEKHDKKTHRATTYKPVAPPLLTRPISSRELFLGATEHFPSAVNGLGCPVSMGESAD
jgi:hypothetical protein